MEGEGRLPDNLDRRFSLRFLSFSCCYQPLFCVLALSPFILYPLWYRNFISSVFPSGIGKVKGIEVKDEGRKVGGQEGIVGKDKSILTFV